LQLIATIDSHVVIQKILAPPSATRPPGCCLMVSWRVPTLWFKALI